MGALPVERNRLQRGNDRSAWNGHRETVALDVGLLGLAADVVCQSLDQRTNGGDKNLGPAHCVTSVGSAAETGIQPPMSSTSRLASAGPQVPQS